MLKRGIPSPEDGAAGVGAGGGGTVVLVGNTGAGGSEKLGSDDGEGGNLSKWMGTPVDGVGAAGIVEVGSVVCEAVAVGMAVVVEKVDRAAVTYTAIP